MSEYVSERIMSLELIFAIDKNNVMGRNNKIPWRSLHDFKWFRSLTVGHSIVMGRKTWESLPTRPLPDRENYVLTSDPDYQAPGAIVLPNLEAAIDHSLKNHLNWKIFVIGGKALLEEAAKYASNAYISHIGVETPVDEFCVMGPTLPPYEVTSTYNLFEGDDYHPPVKAERVFFISN
jgi:dihydrofolate reductase